MEIRVPEVGESIVEALLARWHRRDGEQVRREEPICELETDKVTLEINAEVDGILSIAVPEGETVKIGAVIGTISETGAPKRVPADKPETTAAPLSPAARKQAREKAGRPEEAKGVARQVQVTEPELIAPPEEAEPTESPREDRLNNEPSASREEKQPEKETAAEPQEENADAQLKGAPPIRLLTEEPPTGEIDAGLRVTRKPMTPIRKMISERLTASRRETAMATTFNEADMGRVIALRRKFRDHFRMKHGVSLGFMPFFVKACVEALKEYPNLNARIDGDEIVFQHYYDICIAVSGEKGLVAPAIRNADQLNFAEIEQSIDAFAEKVRTNRLNISDLEGGTFTISNGGVFGSLMSIPIINPPQSAVLGMHVVQDRPVALLGKVVIRPMMYISLTYDHRIIDGREAIQFLKKVKEYIEEPDESLLEG